ncbi:MAG: HNH endonuclease signature motif containing protein [Corynebacterium casei]|uniref:HNH endonuclease signature motif containing protein n=1 Tax=Corynebacterium casei TaxID=160386 RepID=UPI002649FC15|nr:HNH endonuclease signature motif containing protein [Corynebacterium casei]MDN5705593.1 HNH endonuclease [Corynebacterium casei]MDN5727942.1 HNH endonuclease [Corynebacterium casei]MDN5783351.1 HNH endonuclease [Corynebacterium casei]
MDFLHAIKFVYTQGIGFLRLAYEHSPYDLESFGIVLPKAKEYSKLADALLGPADSPRLQREFLALAEQREFSLDHLVMVNRHAKKLKKRGAAWKLRAELIAHEGSYKEVNAYGNRRVKEIQGEKPKGPGVKVSQAKNGMRTMTVTDTQRRITDLMKTLDAIETTEQPRKKALLEAFWKHIDGGGGILKPEYRTVIAIGLDQSAQIIRGEGDEFIIGASDGTTMTGAEIVNLAISGALGDKIYAGLFHPTAGPVNLYEARFASFKQRTLCKAENLVCPWPDCNVPADRCQVHHLDAHKNGGQTNPSNLSTLCAYHNGVNDDGAQGVRHEKSRGRMVRHRGKVKLLTPGGRLVGNTHDLSGMGAMDLI